MGPTVTHDEADDAAREAWRLLFQLFRAQRRAMQSTHAELDLNPGQVHLLLSLEPSQALPMSELAEALACDASYVTGLVDRLEGRDLVHRLPAPTDRRVKLIALTGKGEAVREDVLDRISRPPPFIEALSTADKRALRDIFTRAMQSVHAPPHVPAK